MENHENSKFFYMNNSNKYFNLIYMQKIKLKHIILIKNSIRLLNNDHFIFLYSFVKIFLYALKMNFI